MASSKVCLDQYAHGEGCLGSRNETGGSSGAALELVTHHARSSPHIAFLDGSGSGIVQRFEDVFPFDVESVDIAQVTVPGFTDYGE